MNEAARATLPDFLVASNSRARLLRAGVSLIASSGVDHISSTDVVAVAGVSRSTMYSYFGDVSGLVAEIWSECGLAWLRSFLESDAPLFPPELHLALCRIVAAGLRDKEVEEVVVPDLQTLWQEYAARGDVALVRWVWVLSLVTGSELSMFRDNLDQHTKLADAVAKLRAMPDDVVRQLDLGEAPTFVEPKSLAAELPWVSDLDVVAKSLAASSIEVVARAGVARASTLRICRHARVTTGSMAGRFSNVEDIVVQGFRLWVHQVMVQNVEIASVTLGESRTWEDLYAYGLAMLSRPSRSTSRRFRIEVNLASAQFPTLGNEARESFLVADELLRDYIISIGASPEFAETVIFFDHSFSLGIALLRELGYPVQELDHRIPARWLRDHVGGVGIPLKTQNS